jgi:hypothetical protein
MEAVELNDEVELVEVEVESDLVDWRDRSRCPDRPIQMGK